MTWKVAGSHTNALLHGSWNDSDNRLTSIYIFKNSIVICSIFLSPLSKIHDYGILDHFLRKDQRTDSIFACLLSIWKHSWAIGWVPFLVGLRSRFKTPQTGQARLSSAYSHLLSVTMIQHSDQKQFGEESV